MKRIQVNQNDYDLYDVIVASFSRIWSWNLVVHWHQFESYIYYDNNTSISCLTKIENTIPKNDVEQVLGSRSLEDS